MRFEVIFGTIVILQDVIHWCCILFLKIMICYLMSGSSNKCEYNKAKEFIKNLLVMNDEWCFPFPEMLSDHKTSLLSYSNILSPQSVALVSCWVVFQSLGYFKFLVFCLTKNNARLPLFFTSSYPFYFWNV